MPPTQEVECTAEECFCDMFEVHYTYEVPEEHGVEDLSCPVCGGSDCLRAIDVE